MCFITLRILLDFEDFEDKLIIFTHELNEKRTN